jgi:ATP-binding cassette subfamily C protein CydD
VRRAGAFDPLKARASAADTVGGMSRITITTDLATASPERMSQSQLESRWLRKVSRLGGPATLTAMMLPLVSGALLVVQLYLLSDILDAAIVGGAGRDALTAKIVTVMGILALRISLGFVGERAAAIGSEAILRRIRETLFAALLARRPAWSSAQPSGAISATIVDQVDAMDGFFARFLPAMVQSAVLPLAFAIVILPFDIVIGLLFLVTAPLIPFFMALVGYGAEAARNAEATAFNRLSAHFSDRLRGILTLKLFGREVAEIAAVREASEQLRIRTMAVLRIAFLSSAVLEFFAAIGVAGVALYVGMTYLGLTDLRGEALTLKIGLFCLLMAPEVYQPLRLLAAHYHDRAGAKAAVSAISALFEELPEVVSTKTVDAGPIAGPLSRRPIGIMAQALTVRTPGRDVAVLDEAELSVDPGGSVAIVGPSGCGKSTLIETVAGLRDHGGQVLIGGTDIATMDDAILRRRVALLGQRPRLFQGSIADNIRLGRRTATDAEVREAARLAQVSAFSDLMPDGLATRIGDGGLGLSGGEAHRVALARLYLRDPAILLLDEPTAHLDAATERLVIDGLLGFASERTLVVTTHSHALADRMDRTLRIAGGKLMPVLQRRGVQRHFDGGVA